MGSFLCSHGLIHPQRSCPWLAEPCTWLPWPHGCPGMVLAGSSELGQVPLQCEHLGTSPSPAGFP